MIAHSLPLHVGATMVRREILPLLRFDERLTYGEEWYCWMRLSLTEDLYWTPHPVMWLRRGHGSLMTQSLRRARALPRARLAAYREPGFRPFRRELRWRIAADYRHSAELFERLNMRWAALGRALQGLLWMPNSRRQFSTVARCFGRLRE